MENKVLTTTKRISKRDLIEHLNDADIPDDAACTLYFNRETGMFSLFFYWSEGPGAFGERVIDFESEHKSLKEKLVYFLFKEIDDYRDETAADILKEMRLCPSNMPSQIPQSRVDLIANPPMVYFNSEHREIIRNWAGRIEAALLRENIEKLNPKNDKEKTND